MKSWARTPSLMSAFHGSWSWKFLFFLPLLTRRKNQWQNLSSSQVQRIRARQESQVLFKTVKTWVEKRVFNCYWMCLERGIVILCEFDEELGQNQSVSLRALEDAVQPWNGLTWQNWPWHYQADENKDRQIKLILPVIYNDDRFSEIYKPY